MVLLGLYLIVLARGLRVAMRARDSYGTLLATGITAWIGFQALINIGSVSGSIPFTGVPLPFVSYGGTSLSITLAAIGLLLNISRFTVVRPAPVAPDRATTPLGWRARLFAWRRARPAPPVPHP
jgi:cell division protein FtsW